LTDRPDTMATSVPPAWPSSGDRSLFTGRSWLELFAGRIEGERVWTHVRHGGHHYGLMGSLLSEDLGSEAKNVRRMLTSPCASLRTPDDATLARLSAMAGTAPPPHRWLPSLIYVLPGFECRVATDAVAPDPEAVDTLVTRALAAGDEARAAVVAFLFVPAVEKELRAALTRHGLVRFDAAVESTLTLPGSSFEDYEAALSSSRRGNLRRAYRDVRARGAEFVPAPLADHVDPLVDMLVAERVKHGRRPAREQERAFLDGLCTLPAGRVHLTLARVAGETVGFSVMLDTEPGIRHQMSQGVQDGRAASASLRLVTNFYEPIRAAYQHGVRVLSFGYGSEQQKRQRGCTAAALPVYLRVREPALRPYVRSVVSHVFGG
jgi:GNAT acetyltransferase-like protein